ncbi:MAG: ATPase [Alphaproteobacteria bacterium]|nr:ATPase [Alphaproteobacteria bacterium]
MTGPARTIVTTPSDRTVAISRVFAAPRRLVFEAHIRPELVLRWMWGPDGWPLVECTIDARVGGRFRYVWRHVEKGDMVMRGGFREIVAPERIVHTELFDEDWTGGETVVTTLFEERDGRTSVTATVLYASRAARDGALRSGMTDGWSQALDRLEALLPALDRG